MSISERNVRMFTWTNSQLAPSERYRLEVTIEKAEATSSGNPPPLLAHQTEPNGPLGSGGEKECGEDMQRLLDVSKHEMSSECSATKWSPRLSDRTFVLCVSSVTMMLEISLDNLPKSSTSPATDGACGGVSWQQERTQQGDAQRNTVVKRGEGKGMGVRDVV
ncbi:hypothetical protein BaRGS_00002078 [Batillaria attramentaria]|uniref:Uncharacterized protein n=1 Tax=Batillaria attramentaria TaxID=370345 RepID=A0ABD0M4H3_9CAEN